MNNKEQFIQLLKSTEREGIEDVISELEENGFFKAPASMNHHLNYDGGLLEHSLNVYKCAIMLRDQMEILQPGIKKECPDDSVIIASLLHDVCKSSIYKPAMKKKRNNFGVWEDVPGYEYNHKDFPIGHGEKSVIMLLAMGLQMTDEEMLAIRWHMHVWDLPLQSYELKNNMDAARKMYPLCVIVQSADGLASNILERSEEDMAN